MGYTSYWLRPVALDEETFQLFLGDVRKIYKAVAARGIALADWDGTGVPKATMKKVRFNGEKPGDYESFVLDRVYADRDLHPDEPLKYAFCKTARRPYDIAVCSVLLAFKRHFEEAVNVLSDGWGMRTDGTVERESGWDAAIDFVREILGYTVEWEFDRSGGIQPKEAQPQATPGEAKAGQT